jgi:hypothetical protein
MDDAVRVRDAAREAVMDIEPGPLRTALHTRLTDTAMTPAVLALASARALGSPDDSGNPEDVTNRDRSPISDGAGSTSGGTREHGRVPETASDDGEMHSHNPNTNGDIDIEPNGNLNAETADEDPDNRHVNQYQRTNAGESVHRLPLIDRAAAVQLIYEGLRLTRSLADTEPWVTSTTTDGDKHDNASVNTNKDTTAESGDIDADLKVLAADVFVSRGFALLAQTDAAGRAVDVVRAFGRDQTLNRTESAESAAHDGNLEADIFALAVAVGASAVDETVTQAVVEYVSELSRSYTEAANDGLPPEKIISKAVENRIDALNTDNQDNPVPSSTTDRH